MHSEVRAILVGRCSSSSLARVLHHCLGTCLLGYFFCADLFIFTVIPYSGTRERGGSVRDVLLAEDVDTPLCACVVSVDGPQLVWPAVFSEHRQT